LLGGVFSGCPVAVIVEIDDGDEDAVLECGMLVGGGMSDADEERAGA
jgi:hypothetical protein